MPDWRRRKQFALNIRRKKGKKRGRFSEFLSSLGVRIRQYRTPLVVVALIAASGIGVYSYLNSVLAVSATYTVTSQADWESGEYYPNSFDTTSSSGLDSFN